MFIFCSAAAVFMWSSAAGGQGSANRHLNKERRECVDPHSAVHHTLRFSTTAVSQLTRSLLTMMFFSVVDGGPALKHHWVNVSCLWGILTIYFFLLANSRHWHNDVLMLGQRRRRRPSIKTTLWRCLLLYLLVS